MASSNVSNDNSYTDCFHNFLQSTMAHADTILQSGKHCYISNLTIFYSSVILPFNTIQLAVLTEPWKQYEYINNGLQITSWQQICCLWPHIIPVSEVEELILGSLKSYLMQITNFSYNQTWAHIVQIIICQIQHILTKALFQDMYPLLHRHFTL